MIDPEFFILIEPDYSIKNVHQIIINYKVPIKFFESLIDKKEPSNLNIGFAIFEQGKQTMS